MKMQNRFIKIFLLTVTVITLLDGCKKDASEEAYGFSKIYMPQAINYSLGVNNNYPVPSAASGSDSSSYNYKIDTVNHKVDIILGVALSGPEASAYSVKVSVNNDTVESLLKDGLLDSATDALMPAAIYTIPDSVSVAKDKRENTFYLSVDIAALKQAQFAGKTLVLAVSLAHPSKYILDTSLSTTIVMLNVNDVVVGRASDVTSQYIQNPGNPFIASAMNGSRWGSLLNWNTNTAMLSHDGVGGFSSDGDGQTMDVESGWGAPAIYNGKLYQVVTLPPGNYTLDPTPLVWDGTMDTAYMVVAPASDTLPDYADIANNPNVYYATMGNPVVNFRLTETTKVAIGFVVNYLPSTYGSDGEGFKIKYVHLYAYLKHL